MARLRGKIVWFCASKGFGFITRDGGADVFCPKRAVSSVDLPRLGDGAEVEFDVTGPEGLQAEHVALVAG
jgi:CspA family cold shock protein